MIFNIWKEIKEAKIEPSFEGSPWKILYSIDYFDVTVRLSTLLDVNNKFLDENIRVVQIIQMIIRL